MPQQRSLALRRTAFAFLALAAFAAADSGVPPGVDLRAAREPVSVAPLDPFGLIPGSTNFDFAAKALLGPTTGVAYNAAAKHVYAGNQRVFSIYNALVPDNLGLVGRVEIPPSTYPGWIISVVYPGSGHYVFVTVAADGLYTIDVANPAQPTIAGKYVDHGSGSLAIAGTVAYMATHPRDVVILDVSDPADPTLLGIYAPFSGLVGDIFAANGYAYVVAQNGLFDPVGVWIIDATNPAAPVKVNDYHFDSDVSGLAGAANRLYVTSTNAGLAVFDLATPAAPAFLGQGAGTIGAGYAVVPAAGRAYVATGAGLDIIDVGNPSAMTLLGRTNAIPSYGQTFRLTLGAIGYVYLSAYRGGLQVANVSSVTAPTIVKSLPTPGEVRELAVSGDHAYYLSAGMGIFVVDNSIVDRSRIVAVLESASAADALHAVGDRLYYADSALHILDISDPSDPTEIGTASGMYDVQGIDTVGSLVYLARGTNGLTILDTSDPGSPVVLGNTPVTSYARGISVVNGIAYVANWNDGLAIFDVTDPANPTQIGDLDTPGTCVAVDAVGRYAYVADDSHLLLIADVADPSDPLLTGQYQASDDVVDVVVVGDLAYVAARFQGLRVVDVSAPWAPVEVGSYATDEPFFAVAFHGGYALTAETNGGASILHYVGECFDDFEPNDDFAAAFPITDGVTYSPRICDQNDSDYFSITPSAGDTLDITMQPPSGKDYNLFLYDAQQSLVQASVTSGDAVENIERVVLDTGPYFVKVAGSAGQFDSSRFYSLFYLAVPCAVPTQPVYIYGSDVDANFNLVFSVQDPNQPNTVTGYNLYRATHPAGPFTLLGENLTDFDQGTPNVQIVDVDSDSCGPLCFYLITAVNGDCGAEGPGGPEPLPACPSVTPCNGSSCLRSGPPLNSIDTGLRACLTQQGTTLGCGNQTVRAVTYNCVQAPCCFNQPPCLCMDSCPNGTYLECG